MHFYSPEELEWLKTNVSGRPWKVVTEMFNEYFNVDITYKNLSSAAKRYGIKNGVNAQFPKGQVPFNKGMKGVNFGGKETQFKTGNKPHNYKPVGTERINGDGYVDIKVADPKKWKGKHVVVWEQANGPVPRGHAVIFGDGNRRNFEVDNLILVSRKQLAILNQRGLIRDNTDLTKTGVVIADLYLKIGEMKRKL